MKHHLFYMTCLLLVMMPRQVLAHALNAQCTLHRHTIEVEAFYSDATPAASALVQVFKGQVDGKPLATVKTDRKGICFILRLEPGEYIVVVDAGAGHRKQLGMAVPPAAMPGVEMAWGMACLGGLDNLAIIPVLAVNLPRPRRSSPVDDGPTIGPSSVIISDSPTKKDFTGRRWRQVVVGVASIALAAMVVLAVRRRINAR